MHSGYNGAEYFQDVIPEEAWYDSAWKAWRSDKVATRPQNCKYIQGEYLPVLLFGYFSRIGAKYQ